MGAHIKRSLRAAIGAALVGGLPLSACSSGNDTAAPVPDNEAANTIVYAVKDRLAVMPAAAWAKYDSKGPIDSPKDDQRQVANFVKLAVAAGLPTGPATNVITTQVRVGKSVQVDLVRQWSTGVTPIPNGKPAPASQLTELLDAADAELVSGLELLQSDGAPEDWPSVLASAAESVDSQLPEGVTSENLAAALVPISQWPQLVAKAGKH